MPSSFTARHSTPRRSTNKLNTLPTIVFIALSSISTGGNGAFSIDGELFEERPIIVIEEGKYFFEWTQGEWPFAFFPSAKIKEEKVIFYVSVTTSSGNRKGLEQRTEIEKKKYIERIDEDHAFWEEPGGSLIKLEIKRRSNKARDQIAGTGGAID